MVRFGDQIVLDSTFPPFPSKAFDKRLSNYINNVDMQEMPSGIVSLSITNCCPYACAFCSTDAHRKPENDLDEGLLERVIDQIQDLGVAQMILHGGEPMFRYDRFLRLIKRVRKDVCLWTFSTGYGATADKARELKDAGLFGVWVSLDHYDPAIHSKWRGNPEAFDNAVRAVEHFRRAGLYTCLSLVPSDELLEPEGFKKYYDLARDLGVAEIRVLEKKPSGRQACRGVIPHSPVLEQLHKDLARDPAYADYPPLSGLSTWLEKDPALGCQCRFEYLYVTATGEVQPCEASEISFGNIKDEDFLTIYQRACAAFRRPSTGCIPMTMYPEVREFQKVKDSLTSSEKSELSTRIMADFQAKGKVPGVFTSLWDEYTKRVEAYRKRKENRG
jgi:MoaA/NifB/PqqE/SkfB family radical SAM enzyme